jgi:hypothetical protein
VAAPEVTGAADGIHRSDETGASPGTGERDWFGRLGEAREHLAAAQVELLKAVRAALIALEGSPDDATGAAGRATEAGGAVGTLVSMVVRYADRVARRREADVRLKTLTTIREVLVAERRAVTENEGREAPALGGFDAVIGVIERECAAARADGSAPDEAKARASRRPSRPRPLDLE